MVHIVGAGCGAADLITLRGKKMIENADVIIYAGSLVNPQLLEYARKDCRIYDSSRMDLDEVMDVMKSAEDEGLDTVRLHTGDPSIYGAIREQMDRLKASGIEYDICPGVSSLFGAAAALKAEYTLPGVSQTVIITRMEGRTPVPEAEAVAKLAEHGATMVIFLSASMTDKLQQELLKGAYDEDTEAAIVYKATWEDEKIIRCRLGELHETAVRAGIKNLALIAVGGFLGNDYELSKLYDASFETAYREAKKD